MVALYGVVREGPGGSLSTVTEYMANGSLRHVLSNTNKLVDNFYFSLSLIQKEDLYKKTLKFYQIT